MLFTINGILSTFPTIDSDASLKSFPESVNSKICQPYGEPVAQAIHLQHTTNYGNFHSWFFTLIGCQYNKIDKKLNAKRNSR